MSDYPKQAGFDLRKRSAYAEHVDRIKANTKRLTKVAKATAKAKREGDFIESILLKGQPPEVRKLYRKVSQEGTTPDQVAGLMAATTLLLLKAGQDNELDKFRVFTTLPKLIETWRRCLSGDTTVKLPDFQGVELSAPNASESDQVTYQ